MRLKKNMPSDLAPVSQDTSHGINSPSNSLPKLISTRTNPILKLRVLPRQYWGSSMRDESFTGFLKMCWVILKTENTLDISL
jgi:hypothetical protein